MGRSLDQMQSELRSIINELEGIASGIGCDFQGIGSEQCVRKLRIFGDECQASINHLEYIKQLRIEEQRKEQARQELLASTLAALTSKLR